MERLFLVIILALIQPLHAITEYYFSKKDKKLNLLKNNLTDFYGDWLFLIFNFLLIYAVVFSLKLFSLILLGSLLVNVIISYYWIYNHTKTKNEFYMYDIKKKKIQVSGFIHLVFSTIQTTFIFLFLLSSPVSKLFYLELFVLFCFIFFIPAGSIRIHGRFDKGDKFVFILGLAAIMTKLFLVL